MCRRLVDFQFVVQHLLHQWGSAVQSVATHHCYKTERWLAILTKKKKEKNPKANKQQLTCWLVLVDSGDSFLNHSLSKKERKRNENVFLATTPFGTKMQSSGPKGPPPPFGGENAISENDLDPMCLLTFKVPLESQLYFFSLQRAFLCSRMYIQGQEQRPTEGRGNCVSKITTTWECNHVSWSLEIEQIH